MSDTGQYPVGDAYRHYSENFPYNVLPQVRSPEPVGPAIHLKCPADPKIQSIIFDGPNLVVIKGWQWKTKFELNSFFAPVDSFFETEITLKNTVSDDDIFSTFDFSFLNNTDNLANFIAIFPEYHILDENDQSLWKLKFRLTGETEWKNLGKIFIWSTTENSIAGFDLKNEIGEDINIKILIGGNND